MKLAMLALMLVLSSCATTGDNGRAFAGFIFCRGDTSIVREVEPRD